VSKAVLRLKIVLADTEPPIRRGAEVTADTSSAVHAVIQPAMGCEDDHLYQFYRGPQTIPGRLRLDELAARGA
jgi:hypothetical protein